MASLRSPIRRRLFCGAAAASLGTSARAAPAATRTPERQLAVFRSADLARRATAALAAGERQAALRLALQGLPPDLQLDDYTAHFPDAQAVLLRALRFISLRLDLSETVHLSVSPDGTRIATVSMRAVGMNVGATIENAKLWDAATGALIANLLPPELSMSEGATLGELGFSADSTQVACGVPATGEVRVWNASDGRLKATLRSHDPGGLILTGITFSGDGRYVGSYGEGGMQVTDIASGRSVLRRSWLQGGIAMPLFHPEAGSIWYTLNPLAFGPGTGPLEIRRMHPASRQDRVIASVADIGDRPRFVSPDGSCAVLRRKDGDTVVVDLRTGAQRALIPARRSGHGLFFTDDSMALGTGSAETPYFSAEDGRVVEQVDPRQHIFFDSVYSLTGEQLGEAYRNPPRAPAAALPIGAALVKRALDGLSPADRDAVATNRVSW